MLQVRGSHPIGGKIDNKLLGLVLWPQEESKQYLSIVCAIETRWMVAVQMSAYVWTSYQRIGEPEHRNA